MSAEREADPHCARRRGHGCGGVARLVAAARAAARAGGGFAGIGVVRDGEGVPAAARGDGVRVVDLEARLLDRLEIVHPGAREIRRAERVDDDLHALALELVVALLGAAVEAEAVLEPGAPAALDRDAQHRDVLLRGHQVADLRRRRTRQRDDVPGALLDLHLRRIVATWLPRTWSRSRP